MVAEKYVDPLDKGLEFLRQAQESGGIDASMLPDLLDKRRELLNELWALDIWSKLGSGVVTSTNQLLRKLRPTLVGDYTLKSEGIFFPMKKIDGAISWCALLRAKVDDNGKIVKEAVWARLTYRAPELNIQAGITARDVIEFYEGKAGDVFVWLRAHFSHAERKAVGAAVKIGNVLVAFVREDQICLNAAWPLHFGKK